jgi:hypothetical protein
MPRITHVESGIARVGTESACPILQNLLNGGMDEHIIILSYNVQFYLSLRYLSGQEL